ncbi:MAG: AgmX/PglI C-terminal domain-containing protein [Myxococcota bacterium]
MRRLLFLAFLGSVSVSAQEAREGGVLAAMSNHPRLEIETVPEALDFPATQERVAALSEGVQRCVGELQGAWRFDLVIQRRGGVRRVAAEESPSDAEEATRCLETVLRALRLPGRSSGGDQTLRVRIARPLRGGAGPDNALGSLRGSNFGFGGLGLRGTGRGGGGTGQGTIGLGNLGQVGGGRATTRRDVPRVRAGRIRVTGSLSPAIVRRVVRRHLQELRACYESGLQSDPQLRGRVTVEFSINPQGRVTRSQVQNGATLSNTAVQNCLAQAARRWVFPAPEQGSVDVVHPFVFTPPRPNAAVRTGQPEVRGSLSREVIRRVIRRNITQARYCYEQALAQDPTLAGTVKLAFIINAEGQVQSAVVREDGLPDPSVGTCLARVVRRWRFPAPEGGGVVAVTYPFVFSTR